MEVTHVGALVAALRHQRWVVGLVLVLALGFGAVRAAGLASAGGWSYVASRALQVRVVSADSGGLYASAEAQALAERLVAALVTGSTLRRPTLDRSIAAQVAHERPLLIARFGRRLPRPSGSWILTNSPVHSRLPTAAIA
jgi:hypothetical protein